MELIDIRQLRAFQLLVQTGSFTAAGKAMYVTQSAVSHSIKSLETSLDCPLIDRSGKKVAPTAAGEALLRRADRILQEMSLATDELKMLNRWGYGRLRVGATDTMCQYLLPAVLREFRESFPNCEVSIHASDTTELLELLDRGEIDLALGMRPAAEEPGLEFQPLFDDALVFAVSPLHPWVSEGIDPATTMEEQRFIIYSRKSPTFRLVERYLRKLGLRSPQVTELGNMEAIKELAKIGMGVGVVAPWVIRSEIEEGSLLDVAPPGESLVREWGLFRRGRGGEHPMNVETFVGICRTVARGLAKGAGGGIEKVS